MKGWLGCKLLGILSVSLPRSILWQLSRASGVALRARVVVRAQEYLEVSVDMSTMRRVEALLELDLTIDLRMHRDNHCRLRVLRAITVALDQLLLILTLHDTSDDDDTTLKALLERMFPHCPDGACKRSVDGA